MWGITFTVRLLVQKVKQVVRDLLGETLGILGRSTFSNPQPIFWQLHLGFLFGVIMSSVKEREKDGSVSWIQDLIPKSVKTSQSLIEFRSKRSGYLCWTLQRLKMRIPRKEMWKS